MDQEQDYGRIDLIDHHVVRTVDGETRFKIPVHEIKVIGEFTTADGPLLDDWFLTILTEDMWYEVPMYAAGIEVFFANLSKELNSELSYQLAHSTIWKTRIIHPEAYRNEELYKIVPIEPKTLLDKLKKLFVGTQTMRVFSDVTNKIMGIEQNKTQPS